MRQRSRGTQGKLGIAQALHERGGRPAVADASECHGRCLPGLQILGRQLLDQQVNPAIAAHGGYAALQKVEDSKAYITMGGGCQGCAMSALTLREGIETAILTSIPEVTEVVDTTDHSSGENPFY